MITSITLDHVIRQYKGTPFRLHIDRLEFHNRHIHVIVGPNGSGKSTILNLIAFLDQPDEGRVLIDHRPVIRHNHDVEPALRKRIGYVRQNRYLFNMSVFDNVALGLKLRKVPKDRIQSEVDSILSLFELNHLRDRSVKALSNGEYQKVAIAQVLVLKPEVLLIDEPDANIDKLSRLSIEERIKTIHQEHSSVVIMTTHSLKQAQRMSPEIISIHEGRMIDFIHEKVASDNP